MAWANAEINVGINGILPCPLNLIFSLTCKFCFRSADHEILCEEFCFFLCKHVHAQRMKIESIYSLEYHHLLYGKPSPRQIPLLWLVLPRSGFSSTDRFHGNGPIRIFLFLSKAGKFKICNQDSEKKNVKIVILHIETTSSDIWSHGLVENSLSSESECQGAYLHSCRRLWSQPRWAH